jgi:hypothetical protein
MIAITEPTAFSNDMPIEGTEKVRLQYALLGRLISTLPDVEVYRWEMTRHSGIEASLHFKSGGIGIARSSVRDIAERLGIEYVERRHTKGSNQLYIAAKGPIDGVTVRLYELVEAERPFCDDHDEMVDADGVCPECAAAVSIIHTPMPDGAEMPRCGADVNCLIAPSAENVTCPECVARLADDGTVIHVPMPVGSGTRGMALCCAVGGRTALAVADANCPSCLALLQQAAPDAVDEPDDTGYADDQLDRVACSACGVQFTDDETTVEAGFDAVDGRSLRAHPDCLDLLHPTEPQGDTP